MLRLLRAAVAYKKSPDQRELPALALEERTLLESLLNDAAST